MRVRGLLCFAAMVVVVYAMGCDDPDVSQTCAQLTSEAEVAIGLDQAEAGTNRSCASTSDCVVVPTSTNCLPSCSVVLTQAGAAVLQASLAQVNGDICAQFARDGCPANPAPSCAALTASCVAGACTPVFSETGDAAAE